MAVVYGLLGLMVVLTGSKFGALNASPWFNAAIALAFVVLALGMFGLINVDFSRFRGPGGGGQARRGRQTAIAFGAGAVSALLAGACVAPVVISVLVLSTKLYSQGNIAGLPLPFVLGLGMGLPWPFAGAGLTFLPKPGKWMASVKYAFGVLIVVFAAYYAHLAWGLFRVSRATTQLAAGPSGGVSASPDANTALAYSLRMARQQARPVFVDFAASWCKNCAAMDETVFSRTDIQQRLRDFVVIRYEAEQPNESPAREVLDRFGVLGLPTYLVLKPLPARNGSAAQSDSPTLTDHN
jgi:thiol:disulfide interchange protein